MFRHKTVKEKLKFYLQLHYEEIYKHLLKTSFTLFLLHQQQGLEFPSLSQGLYIQLLLKSLSQQPEDFRHLLVSVAGGMELLFPIVMIKDVCSYRNAYTKGIHTHIHQFHILELKQYMSYKKTSLSLYLPISISTKGKKRL